MTNTEVDITTAYDRAPLEQLKTLGLYDALGGYSEQIINNAPVSAKPACAAR